MDRGIPTEAVLAEMRAAETPTHYLVGDVEAQFARPTAAKDHVGWQSEIAMTPASVVPSLQDPTTGNRRRGALFGVSCGRRVSVTGSGGPRSIWRIASAQVRRPVERGPAGRYRRGRSRRRLFTALAKAPSSGRSAPA
jgi:hypothetical protein